jgi:putative ABC transport system permease protein
MIRLIRTFFAVFIVAAKRLWSTRWLTLAGGLGFVAAIALAFSVPLYADAVYHRILSRELGISDLNSSPLPPFSFLFRQGMFFQENANWGDILPADRFMDQQAPVILQLPRKTIVRYFQTANLRLFSLLDPDAFERREPLLSIPVVSISDIGDHINLLAGTLPPDQPDKDGYIGVLISKLVADRLGMQVGDKYVAFTGRQDAGSVRVPVVISGVWEPRDRLESYWFYRPDQLDVMLLTSEPNFRQAIAPIIGDNISEVLWFMDFDGDSVRVWNAADLSARIDQLVATAKAQKLNLDMAASPQDALLRYQRDSRTLMLQLYTFSVPIFVLVLAFVILVAGLMVNSQRAEIAILRSRGATGWQVFGISLLGACGLALVTFGAGAVAALGIAMGMGQARSFLSFISGDTLPVALTQTSLPFGAVAAVVAVLITVLPVIGAARYTILSYKQERARSMRPPWWQRAWLDVLLLIPAAYWTYLLARQGTLDIPLLDVATRDPLSNPAMFLVPALAIFALTLFLIRLMPLFLRLLAWLLGKLPGVSLVMAARQLARSPGLYVAPMLLLVLTLALATYTASVATTLDQYMDQQVRYTVGGDMTLVGTGQDTQAGIATTRASLGSAASISADATTGSSDDLTAALQQTQAEEAGPRFQFIPISDYLKVNGVQAATRVGHYPATMRFSVGGNTSGHVMGIDRGDFAHIAFWRNDFAAQPFGALMNALAAAPDGILVPDKVMSEQVLRVGDSLPVRVELQGTSVDITFRVVGSFSLWPSWYPNDKDEGPLIIANLDYIFESTGGQSPYDVWLKVRPGVNPTSLIPALRSVDSSSWKDYDVNSMLLDEQTQPERQGLFGMLSIGFLAAGLFTVLGFFLYAVFSFRRRFIELGVLRAIGLSAEQMAFSLAWEMALLLGMGIAAGTALGFAASRYYIPFLQVGPTDPTRALPFIVTTDWSAIYALYGVLVILFIVIVAALVILLSRIRIFQAVKLGEAE